MKKEFYTEIPSLSAEEEVVAHAGEDKDNWAGAPIDGTIGLAKMQVDKEGKLTEKYRKLIAQLHVFDEPPGKKLTEKEKREAHLKLDKLTQQWRRIQKKKAETKTEAKHRIELRRDGYVRS